MSSRHSRPDPLPSVDSRLRGNDDVVTQDPWVSLKIHTPARVALGRSGVSLPTQELLRFGSAHAMAHHQCTRDGCAGL